MWDIQGMVILKLTVLLTVLTMVILKSNEMPDEKINISSETLITRKVFRRFRKEKISKTSQDGEMSLFMHWYTSLIDQPRIINIPKKSEEKMIHHMYLLNTVQTFNRQTKISKVRFKITDIAIYQVESVILILHNCKECRMKCAFLTDEGQTFRKYLSKRALRWRISSSLKVKRIDLTNELQKTALLKKGQRSNILVFEVRSVTKEASLLLQRESYLSITVKPEWRKEIVARRKRSPMNETMTTRTGCFKNTTCCLHNIEIDLVKGMKFKYLYYIFLRSKLKIQYCKGQCSQSSQKPNYQPCCVATEYKKIPIFFHGSNLNLRFRHIDLNATRCMCI